MMLKDGESPQKDKEESQLYTEGDSFTEKSNTREEMEKKKELDAVDSDSSSDRSPSVSSSIPTCVVAPTSNDAVILDENGLPYIPSRKQREFIPENKKDDHYWEKRRKNNDAARRSREKRRLHDVCLENRIVDLTRDNLKLRNELFAIKRKYGIPLNETIVDEDETSEINPNPITSMSNSPGGMSPGKSVMMGYMAGVTQAPLLPNSTPPPLLKMAGGIPVGLSVPPGSYGANSPMPLFVAVPTSEHQDRNHVQHISESSLAPSTSRNYEPPPAHSHMSMKDVTEDENLYERNSFYTGNDTQGNIAATSYLQHSEMRDRSGSSVSQSSSKQLEMSDETSQDQPLSLCVRKRVDSFSGNESSTSVSSCENSPLSQSPPSTALPHKLRHKMPADFKTAYSQNVAFPNPLFNGLAQLSEIALAQSGPLPLLKKSHGNRRESGRRSTVDNPRSHIDPKYAERRRRNNEAARKCRENRKSLTKLREAKSDFLESENSKLRNELDSLQGEMNSLRSLIEKKRNKEQNLQNNSKGTNEVSSYPIPSTASLGTTTSDFDTMTSKYDVRIAKPEEAVPHKRRIITETMTERGNNSKLPY